MQPVPLRLCGTFSDYKKVWTAHSREHKGKEIRFSGYKLRGISLELQNIFRAKATPHHLLTAQSRELKGEKIGFRVIKEVI